MISRGEFTARAREQYVNMLARHQLLEEAYWPRGAMWLIGQPGSSTDLTQIIVGACGALIVQGDHPCVRFQWNTDPPWSRLLWLSGSPTVLGYVLEKAQMGMDGRGVHAATQYVAEVAEFEIRQLAEEHAAEALEHAEAQESKLIAHLNDALHHVEHEHELWEAIHDGDEWDLWEHDFGRCPSYGVIFAHAAISRCVALLTEKYGESGPPEAR